MTPRGRGRSAAHGSRGNAHGLKTVGLAVGVGVGVGVGPSQNPSSKYR